MRISFLVSMSLCSLLLVSFLAWPLGYMAGSTPPGALGRALADLEVQRAIGLSLYASGAACLLALWFGTPLAYLLARGRFPGRELIKALVDLPMVIPHPVIGIALLAAFGRQTAVGRWAEAVGIRIMGSTTGIVAVLLFVGLPFYVNAVREAVEMIPERLEHVSRTLGAGPWRTFFRVVLPLAREGVLSGLVMCGARALSEFGAVVVVAYHPMVAPVLIYERFESFGLQSSRPIAVLLIGLCLTLFLLLRLMSRRPSHVPGPP